MRASACGRGIGENNRPLFKYFLDGSRRIYKVDDIIYDKKVFPIIAGQICVGCCCREDKKLFPFRVEQENVIALPNKADKDGNYSDSKTYVKKYPQQISSVVKVF